MTIKPLQTLSREEVRDLARQAVERDEPMVAANVFEPGTLSHAHFMADYYEHVGVVYGEVQS